MARHIGLLTASCQQTCKFEKLVHLVDFIMRIIHVIHVEFYFKNKFEKLVHLVGFITRIYHDARSSERQTVLTYINSTLLTRTYT